MACILHTRIAPVPLPTPTHLFLWKAPCSSSLEGIVSKHADAPFAPGNRGLWIKVKCLNREEFVVVGWTDPESSRPLLGALLFLMSRA